VRAAFFRTALHPSKRAWQARTMKRTIQFHVWRGERFYVAQAADVPIVTQGSTLEIC